MIAAFAPAPPPLARASDRILDALRRKILTLDLPPGAKLDELEIARAHGVSRTPAREAMLALAQEGLVAVRPQSGTYVALIDADAALEAMEARRVLEELCARRAAERRVAPDVFRESLRRAREAAAAQDGAAFEAAGAAFHAALAEAAQARSIGALSARLRAPVERLRRLAAPVAGSDRMKRGVDEREAIVAEIGRGEAKAAARAMRRHLAAGALDVEQARAAHPAFFAPPQP
jgi:DNA-binding GntR family transcriptional regulator